MKKQQEFTLAETFVGVGGSHLGFKQAGFKTVYVNDNDSDMIAAFKLNNPELPDDIIDGRPIQEVDASDVLEIARMERGKLDVLLGGIVCCGFSLAGVRDPSDPRNTLYKEQLRLVAGFYPKVSVIENVPAMNNFLILKEGADEKKKDRIRHIHQRLEDFKGIKAERRKKNLDLTPTEKDEYEQIKKERKELAEFVKNNSINIMDDIRAMYDRMGYKVDMKILNAAWYSAATMRMRMIIVAVRKDLNVGFSYPRIEYWEKAGPRNEVLQYYNNMLPKDMFREELKSFRTIKDSLGQIDFRGGNNPRVDKDNMPMKHHAKSVERFRLIPRGKNIVDIMDKIPKHLRISRYYSRGCTMRLAPGKPAPTLVPGHSNFPVHPYKHRSITVREAATITGFPLDYKFHGSHTKRCLQVGNAVPPSLARAVALQVRETLERYYKREIFQLSLPLQ